MIKGGRPKSLALDSRSAGSIAIDKASVIADSTVGLVDIDLGEVVEDAGSGTAGA